MNLLLRNQIPFHIRQRWRVRGIWTHVGPDHSVPLLAWIRLDLHTFLQAAADRLRGHVSHRACHVEFPTVVYAAQATVFIAPKDQGRATMRARLIDETHAPFGVSE